MEFPVLHPIKLILECNCVVIIIIILKVLSHSFTGAVANQDSIYIKRYWSPPDLAHLHTLSLNVVHLLTLIQSCW